MSEEQPWQKEFKKTLAKLKFEEEVLEKAKEHRKKTEREIKELKKQLKELKEKKGGRRTRRRSTKRN